jgi:hypothetical protein
MARALLMKAVLYIYELNVNNFQKQKIVQD